MEAEAHHYLLAWTAKEPGLLGSTEWAEQPLRRIGARTPLPTSIQTVNGRGYLRVEGSHTLEKFSNDIARDISDPETKIGAPGSVSNSTKLPMKTSEQREEIANARSPHFRLGSGRTTLLSCSMTACALNIGSAAKTRAASTIHLR